MAACSADGGTGNHVDLIPLCVRPYLVTPFART